MKDILADLDRWHATEEAIALATVVQTRGSSPRRVGAKMALTASGQMYGSISGGCVEGAVYETGLDVIKTVTRNCCVPSDRQRGSNQRRRNDYPWPN